MKYCSIFLLCLTILCSCAKKSEQPVAKASVVGTWKIQTIMSSTYNKNASLKRIDTLIKLNDANNYFINYKPNGLYESYTLNNKVKANSEIGTYVYDANTQILTEALPPDNNNSGNITPGRVRRGNLNIGNSYSLKLKFVNNNTLQLLFNYYDTSYPAYDNPITPVTIDSVVSVSTLVRQY